ncbi:Unknown protein [Striga hermonthica]|uniref:CCHC-type domain-containing protein n=1 Tax=Striga hermonthica TaxID=68872 RepID=A0A9N7R009_STRHE|nr:Unknown protein [Striga hermonthica]
MEDDDWQDLQERAAGTIWLCLADEVMYHTEEITSALLAHNQRKQKSGESSSQSDSLYLKSNQYRGRKQVRDNSRNQNFRSKSRDKSKGKKTVTCYKCKEQGHFKRDCPKWKKQTVDMSSKSANVVQNEESDCSDGDMLSISTTQYDDAWILDSGCSCHITPNREWFATYKPGNSSSIFLGDDRCCGIVAVLDKGESSSSAPDDVDHDVSGPTDVPESYKLARDREFEMKNLGAAKKIIGMEIHRDRGSKKLWLSQKGYVEKVLQRFGMN